ncbi:MAG: hypothetical protein AB1609_05085 [Bacillota bacterium]
MTILAQQTDRSRAVRLFLGDLASLFGGGGTVSFFLTNWWLPALSPFPWLARHGAAAALAMSLAVGLLLGVRTQRAGRAMLYTLLSFAAGATGLALVLSAPALAGVPGGSRIAALIVPSRVVISLFFLAPLGLLGSVVGASASGGRAGSRMA